MAKKPALKTARSSFLASIDSAENLFAAASPFIRKTYAGLTQNALHPEQARRVVALAFLAAVSAWEEFVEFSFTRYLAGAKSLNGSQPVPRAGFSASVRHSYELLAGVSAFNPDRQYLNWGVSETLKRAHLYFAGGQPYSGVLGSQQQRLSDAFIIRHRVAHSSRKARSDFRKVAIQLVAPGASKLRQGYSVGELLISPAVRGFGSQAKSQGISIFEEHLKLFRHLGARLVP